MIRTLSALVLASTLFVGCGIVTAKAPVLSPTAEVIATTSLGALQVILKAEVNPPASVLNAISVAQQAIAQDQTGATWGALLRTTLSTVYSDLPAADQNNPTIEALVGGIEAAIETVGA
jgi:hypothetical protein